MTWQKSAVKVNVMRGDQRLDGQSEAWRCLEPVLRLNRCELMPDPEQLLDSESIMHEHNMLSNTVYA